MGKEIRTSSVVNIPVGDGIKALTATWSDVNELLVRSFHSGTYADARENRLVRQRTNITTTDGDNSEILWKLRMDIPLLYDPLLRKLVNESCALFVSAHNAVDLCSDSSNLVVFFLKLSRKYRSIIRECVESMQEEIADMEGVENNFYSTIEERKKLIALLYNLEFVWHLTEALHVDATPGDVAIVQLLAWIRFHVPEPDRKARAIVEILSTADSAIGGAEWKEEYWDTTIALLLQGNIQSVRILLQFHPMSQNDDFQKIDKLLRTMPQISRLMYGMGFVDGNSPSSRSEFNLQWNLWQSNAKTLLRNISISNQYEQHSYRHLETILKIISGDADCILDSVNRFGGSGEGGKWYEAMVSILLFTEPNVKCYELGYHAANIFSRQGGKSTNLFDQVLLNLFQSDLSAALSKMQLASDGGWLCTHLGHLLLLAGKLSSDNKSRPQAVFTDEMESVKNEGEALGQILEYGCLLMSHSSLWQAGICYLDRCVDRGPQFATVANEARERMCLLLSRLVGSARSHLKVVKLVAAARRRGFHQLASSMCRMEGMRSVNEGGIGRAMEWAVRGNDAALGSHLAELLLRRCAAGDRSLPVTTSADLLDYTTGPSMLLCDRLTFLGKYCEFQKLITDGEVKEAATGLIDLINSKLSPKFFWMTLLTNGVELLERRGLLSSDQIASLAFALHELYSNALLDVNLVTTDDGKRLPLQRSLPPNFERSLRLIRVSLCDSMAASFFLPSS